MVDINGILVSAHQDTCKNYSPDKDKPIDVKSVKLGMIYECENLDVKSKVDPFTNCFYCKNRNQ